MEPVDHGVAIGIGCPLLIGDGLPSSCILIYHDVMALQKFSSQARPDLLEEVRAIAAEEGRQFQAILDEALAEWVARKRGDAPRPEVLGHLKASIARHRGLYEELAK